LKEKVRQAERFLKEPENICVFIEVDSYGDTCFGFEHHDGRGLVSATLYRAMHAFTSEELSPRDVWHTVGEGVMSAPSSSGRDEVMDLVEKIGLSNDHQKNLS